MVEKSLAKQKKLKVQVEHDMNYLRQLVECAAEFVQEDAAVGR